MIIQFKSTPEQPTARCIKQKCLIEQDDWIKVTKNGLICMFCDDSIREFIREKEKKEKENGSK